MVMKIEERPIFVVGIPRSGTSMIAEIFLKCGAWVGDVSKPKHTSKRGLFENKKIFYEMVQPYMESIGADPSGQYPLPNPRNLFIPQGWKEKCLELIEQEGYRGNKPWVYKSNKLALLWPIWHAAFPNAKWVLVRRRTGDIIQSCTKTAYMKAFKDEKNREEIGAKTEKEAWLWWVHQYENIFIDMINEGVNIKVVWPERIVTGDYTQIYEAIDWAGLPWRTEVLSFLDPKFWKVRGQINGKSNPSRG